MPAWDRTRSDAFWNDVREREAAISDKLEWAGLRDAFRQIFALSSYGNRVFQAAEPWKTRKTDPVGTHALLSDLVYLIRDLSVLTEPYIPATAARLRTMLGAGAISWADMGTPSGLSTIEKPEILFEQLSDELIAEMRERFSGSQAERAARARSWWRRSGRRRKEWSRREWYRCRWRRRHTERKQDGHDTNNDQAGRRRDARSARSCRWERRAGRYAAGESGDAVWRID